MRQIFNTWTYDFFKTYIASFLRFSSTKRNQWMTLMMLNNDSLNIRVFNKFKKINNYHINDYVVNWLSKVKTYRMFFVRRQIAHSVFSQYKFFVTVHSAIQENFTCVSKKTNFVVDLNIYSSINWKKYTNCWQIRIFLFQIFYDSVRFNV